MYCRGLIHAKRAEGKEELMNKKLKNLLLISLVSVTPFGIANAADVESKGEVIFKENADPINPVDPDEGGEIISPRPPTDGPLSINYASDISFGKQVIANSMQTYLAENDLIELISTGEQKLMPNFVQVTDLRGKASGWTLGVKQNSKFHTKDGHELANSSLTLKKSTVRPQIQEMPENFYPKSTIDQPVTLLNDQLTEVARADAGTGIATWNIFLGDFTDQSNNLSLTIPAGDVKAPGIYNTTLTWVLQDVL